MDHTPHTPLHKPTNETAHSQQFHATPGYTIPLYNGNSVTPVRKPILSSPSTDSGVNSLLSSVMLINSSITQNDILRLTQGVQPFSHDHLIPSSTLQAHDGMETGFNQQQSKDSYDLMYQQLPSLSSLTSPPKSMPVGLAPEPSASHALSSYGNNGNDTAHTRQEVVPSRSTAVSRTSDNDHQPAPRNRVTQSPLRPRGRQGPLVVLTPIKHRQAPSEASRFVHATPRSLFQDSPSPRSIPSGIEPSSHGGGIPPKQSTWHQHQHQQREQEQEHPGHHITPISAPMNTSSSQSQNNVTTPSFGTKSTLTTTIKTLTPTTPTPVTKTVPKTVTFQSDEMNASNKHNTQHNKPRTDSGGRTPTADTTNHQQRALDLSHDKDTANKPRSTHSPNTIQNTSDSGGDSDHDDNETSPPPSQLFLDELNMEIMSFGRQSTRSPSSLASIPPPPPSSSPPPPPPPQRPLADSGYEQGFGHSGGRTNADNLYTSQWLPSDINHTQQSIHNVTPSPHQPKAARWSLPPVPATSRFVPHNTHTHTHTAVSRPSWNHSTTLQPQQDLSQRHPRTTPPARTPQHTVSQQHHGYSRPHPSTSRDIAALSPFSDSFIMDTDTEPGNEGDNHPHYHQYHDQYRVPNSHRQRTNVPEPAVDEDDDFHVDSMLGTSFANLSLNAPSPAKHPVSLGTGHTNLTGGSASQRSPFHSRYKYQSTPLHGADTHINKDIRSTRPSPSPSPTPQPVTWNHVPPHVDNPHHTDHRTRERTPPTFSPTTPSPFSTTLPAADTTPTPLKQSAPHVYQADHTVASYQGDNRHDLEFFTPMKSKSTAKSSLPLSSRPQQHQQSQPQQQLKWYSNQDHYSNPQHGNHHSQPQPWNHHDQQHSPRHNANQPPLSTHHGYHFSDDELFPSHEHHQHPSVEHPRWPEESPSPRHAPASAAHQHPSSSPLDHHHTSHYRSSHYQTPLPDSSDTRNQDHRGHHHNSIHNGNYDNQNDDDDSDDDHTTHNLDETDELLFYDPYPRTPVGSPQRGTAHQARLTPHDHHSPPASHHHHHHHHGYATGTGTPHDSSLYNSLYATPVKSRPHYNPSSSSSSSGTAMALRRQQQQQQQHHYQDRHHHGTTTEYKAHQPLHHTYDDRDRIDKSTGHSIHTSGTSHQQERQYHHGDGHASRPLPNSTTGSPSLAHSHPHPHTHTHTHPSTQVNSSADTPSNTLHLNSSHFSIDMIPKPIRRTREPL